jgi:hypothetical protein
MIVYPNFLSCQILPWHEDTYVAIDGPKTKPNRISRFSLR